MLFSYVNRMKCAPMICLQTFCLLRHPMFHYFVKQKVHDNGSIVCIMYLTIVWCAQNYVSGYKKKKVKVNFYIAQYPVYRTAQSAFTHYFPGRPVQSNTISTSLGSIQPHATINVRKAARTHIHHCLLAGTHLYS